MTATFKLEYLNRHLMATLLSGRWVVDTGAPSSFGKTIDLGANQIHLKPNYMGLTPESLSSHIGLEVDGLIGADLMEDVYVIFDVPGGSMQWLSEPPTVDGEVHDLDFFMGIPIIEVGLDGVRYRMFLDSGAPYSYFQEAVWGDRPVVERVQDFYPGYGTFETDLVEMDWHIGSLRLKDVAGQMPSILGLTFGMAGVSGILGNRLFLDRKVVMCTSNNWLKM